ncbi:MAG TPA: PaaI family thioesterase [Vicinamibacteria bacterium]|nr:PaaI family thioesterase [Vicinamibacteria bacterium]
MTLERLQHALDEPPYQRFLGLQAVAFDPVAGSVTIRLPFRRELCRSSTRPELHGGVTAALIDIAGDYALAARLGRGIPTIDLRIDFLRMAVETDLIATARVVKAGRTLGVVNVEVHDEGGQLVAIGRGTYYTKS